MDSMKLDVRFEIEVDEAAWVAEYGTDPANVARDTEDYLLNLVQECPAADAFDITGYAVHEATRA
jgi:hypothetical protein